MMLRLLLLGFLVSSAAICNNTWVKVNSFDGGQRERTISFSIGGKGYVGLGQDTANLMENDFWEYDPATDSWTQKVSFPGTARRNAYSFTIGLKGYIGGGIDNADAVIGIPLVDFWEYDPVMNLWTQKPNCPIAGNNGVYYGCGFSVSGIGYVCTGKIGPSTYTSQMYAFNPASNTWGARANFPGGVRYGASAFVIGSYAYVGLGAGENAFGTDFWRYNPASNNWLRIADYPGSGRYTCSAFSLLGKGYIVLGTDGGYRDELMEYDPVTDTWVQRASYGGGKRRNSAAFVIGTHAYVGTGKDLDGCRRDFWMYSPWTPLGIPDNFTGDFPVSFYPNPLVSSSTLKVFTGNIDKVKMVSISDLKGSVVQQYPFTGDDEMIINRNGLAEGVYLIRLESEQGLVSTLRVLVKNF
jgi:N-acetylneuraminic acid mutarotase